MINYYISRLFQYAVTIVAVITITFGLIRLMPGGPMDYIMAQYAERGLSAARMEAVVAAYTNIQPDDPLYVQYFDYFSSLMMGNMGYSMWYQEPVSEILFTALPWTVFIMGQGLIITYAIAIVLGAVMAYKESSWFDLSNSGLATLSASIPYYILALVMISVLAGVYDLFPMRGNVDHSLEAGWNLQYIFSLFHHAALPVISMAATSYGLHTLTMRGNSISILGEDYMRVGRLRGLSENRLALRYVARNAILPLYTNILISIGFMFGGSIVIEWIFNYPGVGFYLFTAIQSRDYPLMMGAFILITVAVATGVLIADLTYGKLDPRIGQGAER